MRLNRRSAIAALMPPFFGVTRRAFAATRAEKRKSALEKLDLRVDSSGWGNARHADLKAVLESSCSELAVHFDTPLGLEPIRVRHGSSGPITHYKRTVRGEIMVVLSSHNRFWCQHAYQMAHEFGHILCRYKKGDRTNQWFEESVCEMASIFAMRQMAETWKTAPPYPNWKDYSKSLDSYAADLVAKYALPDDIKLDAWYSAHAETLEKEATNRTLNGRVAVRLLPWFEKNPENWRAIAYLNEGLQSQKRTFKDYLGDWHRHCPGKYRPLVVKVGKELGVIS